MSRKQTLWNRGRRSSNRPAASYSKQINDEEARERRKWWYRFLMAIFAATAAIAATFQALAPGFLVPPSDLEEIPFVIPGPARHESCDDTGYRANAVALAVDLSDPADEAVLDRLHRMLVDQVTTLPAATFVLTAGIGDENLREPLVEVTRTCNPGTSADRDVYHESPNDAANDFAAFQADLTTGLEKLFTPDKKDFSPICEAVTSLLRQPEMRSADIKSLVLASDFLQFTKTHSAYRNSNTFQEAWPKSCEASLHGVAVTLYVIERGIPSQTEQLFSYWRDNLLRLGAQSVNVIKI